MLSPEVVYKVVHDFLGPQIFKEYADGFEARLKLQKAIYMFQELAGVKGFDYSWYLAGPYSPELTKLVFNHFIDASRAGEYDPAMTECTEWNDFGNRLMDGLQCIFNIEKSKLKQYGLTETDWYELLASSHYIRKNNNYSDREEVIEKLARTKKRFSPEAIAFVVNEYWKRYQDAQAVIANAQ